MNKNLSCLSYCQHDELMLSQNLRYHHFVVLELIHFPIWDFAH